MPSLMSDYGRVTRLLSQALVVAIFAIAMCACGQRGDLVLPDSDDKPPKAAEANQA